MIPNSLNRAVWSALAVLGLHSTCIHAASYVVTFEYLTLTPNSYYLGPDTNPAGGSGTLSAWTSASGQASFNHYNDAEWFSWAGFSHSNGSDTTTAGFGNQHSAYPGGGAAANGAAVSGTNFALGYHDSFNAIAPTISLPAGEYLGGLYVANTTYAYLYMLSGLDGFMDNPANKFGGLAGTDPDFLKLTATGYDPGNFITGSVDFYLADFRSSDSGQDFIRQGWSWMDLSALGSNANKVTFTMTSSDPFAPTYFAADFFQVAPEPSRGLLVMLGITAAFQRRSRRAGTK